MGWVKRVAPVNAPGQHRCSMPSWADVKREGLGEDSVWECECGARYSIIAVSWPRVYWSPMPGSPAAVSMRKPEYQP